MFKKILKSIFKNQLHHQKYGSSSDHWKKKNHYKHSQMGHYHYKKKHKSGSFLSSFFSS
ncbi:MULTISPECIES: hypothetical protein [Neobacillus]|uniref:Uncharacterized protein n=1 Tax=Neobacillus citreus TaxID=2833578 RepID=A0A9J6MVW6_9BACI|nr:hypothetical protein [Neobacillus citreus]MCH6268125.1 hypothetical protein [Neobacillus citreus]